MKFYFSPVGGSKAGELSDLFLDPDEPGLHNATTGSTKLVNEMSNLSGPYGAKMRRVNCCVDDWWSEPASIGTICSGGCRPISPAISDAPSRASYPATARGPG